MKKETLSALRSSASAEIQAIAIYEAEVWWIRKSDRRKLLMEILGEEREHGYFISKWVTVSSFEKRLLQITGWCLGSALSLLPWALLCKVQAWAESQASKIYFKTLEQVRSDLSLKDNRDALIQGLREAAKSEASHARRFGGS